MTTDYKVFKVEFDVKSEKVEDGLHTFEGYASTFGNRDLVNDSFRKGAFAKTIKESGPPKNNIKVLWQHDWQKPIGLPEVLSEDDHGLYFKAVLNKTSWAKDAWEALVSEAVDKISVGFDPVRYEIDKDDVDDNGFVWREFIESKLREFSPVTFPCNPEADITGFKEYLHGLYIGDAKSKAAFLDRPDLAETFIKNLKSGKMAGRLQRSGEVKELLNRLQALVLATPDSDESYFAPDNTTQNIDEKSTLQATPQETADNISDEDAKSFLDAIEQMKNI